MQQRLTIGKLAQAAAVHVETIRYYQRLGLLEEPPKPLGGQRHYPAAAAQRLQFIKRSQALGFTLSEVGSLLALDGVGNCAQARELATHKLALIAQKMADLSAMQQTLEALVQQCDEGQHQPGCPIIERILGGN
jgi:MerR family mercuric resistance operon transcriptional regulator